MGPDTNDKHEQFTAWAKSKGININGVAPFRFPGKGMGIMATRRIEVLPPRRLPSKQAVLLEFVLVHSAVAIADRPHLG